MSAMFEGMNDYVANGSGVFIPSYMKKGDQTLMKAIAELAQGVDTNAISPSEKRTLDKQLEKKIGTLFRIYYNLWNSSVAWGAAEKPVSTPTTELLRETARQSLVDRLLINARVFQVRHVCRRVAHDSHDKGWSVKSKNWEEYDYKPTPDIDRRCQEMEELILHPNVEIHGSVNPLRDALAKMVRGELVIDRKTMVVIKNRFGIPQSWWLLPPDNIKPRLQVLLKHMAVFKFYSQDQAIQDIWNKFQVDLTNAAYVQEIDNKIFGAWTADECIVDYVNPSDEIDRWGWGVCVGPQTRIPTDRGSIPAGIIARDKLPVKVRARDRITGEVDWVAIDGWSRKSFAGTRRKVGWGPGGKGFQLECTPEHPLLTPEQPLRGVPAAELKVGDRVLVESPVPSEPQKQVILGCLLGDGSLVRKRRSSQYPAGRGLPYFVCSHGPRQYDYLTWKAAALESLGANLSPPRQTFSSTNKRGELREHELRAVRVPASFALWNIYERVCDQVGGERRIVPEWLDQLDELGLAVWGMDDGSLALEWKKSRGKTFGPYPRWTFHTNGWSRDECLLLMSWLDDRWGLHSVLQSPPSFEGQCQIRLTFASTRRFLEIIHPFIQFAEGDNKKVWVAEPIEQGLEAGTVTAPIVSNAPFKGKGAVCDFHVPGYSNFEVGGNLFVHNSPLEESLEATTLLMLSMHYNKQLFLANFPEAFLFINGDVDQEGLEVFKKQIYAQIGTQGNARLPVFATGDSNFRTELHRLRDSLTDMQFIQLLRFAIALKCAAFRAHPSLINFSPDMGDSKALINEQDQEALIASTQEEGYHSLLSNLGDFITAGLIAPVYDDLRLVWSIEDRPTKSELIDLWTKRVALGDTIDEYRRDMHEPPLEEVTDGQLSGKMVNSPFVLQFMQMKEQSAMQQQQLQMEQQRQSGEGFSGMEGQEQQAPARLQGR